MLSVNQLDENPKPPSVASSLDCDGENLEVDDSDTDQYTEGEYLHSSASPQLTHEHLQGLQALEEQLSQEVLRPMSALGRAPDPIPLQFALDDADDVTTALHRLRLRPPPASPSALDASRDIVKVTNAQPEKSGSDVIGDDDDDEEPTPLDLDAQAPGGSGLEGGTPKLAEAESLSSGNSDAEDAHLPTAATTATASCFFTPPTGSPAVSPLLSLSNASSCNSAAQSESESRASSEEVDLSRVQPAQGKARAPVADDDVTSEDVSTLLDEQLKQHQVLQQRLAAAKGKKSL